jgi:hypothetical protein
MIWHFLRIRSPPTPIFVKIGPWLAKDSYLAAGGGVVAGDQFRYFRDGS